MMRWLKGCLCGLSLTATLIPLAPAQAQGRPADLWSVYQLALEHDAQLKAAEAAYLAALEVKPQARSALLPQLNVTGNFDRANQDLTTSSGSASFDNLQTKTWSLNLAQSIYRHEYWVQLRQADSVVAQAKASVEAARQDLIVRVSDAYFNLLGAEDNLEFVIAEKEAIGRQLEQAQKRFEVGLIAITDVKESQARFDQAVAGEIDARNLLDNRREELQVLTGQYIESVASLSEKAPLVPPEPQKMESWVDTALQENLQLTAARFASEAAQQEVAKQRSGHYPYVDLTAGYTDRNADQIVLGGVIPITADVQSETAVVGVQATVPLYSGGFTSSKVREAQASFQQAQDQLELQRRETVRQARASYLNVMADVSSVQAFARALDSTQTAAEATQAGFEVGTRTAVDVLITLSNVYQAERDYARARYKYVLDGMRLKQAAGTLAEEDLQKVNVWMEAKQRASSQPGTGTQ